MAAIKKMGSLKEMLGMMPGMGQMREQLDALDEGQFDRVEAMVRSMTPFERTHPKQINGSRRARIARGSGVTVSEVNQLLERFTDAQKMMRSMRRGGGPGIPGMPAIPGMGGGARKGKQQQRKKGKSGNPAKRAAEEKAALERAAGARAAAANAAFSTPGSALGAGGQQGARTAATRWTRPASSCPRASRSSSAAERCRQGRQTPASPLPRGRQNPQAYRVGVRGTSGRQRAGSIGSGDDHADAARPRTGPARPGRGP